MIIEKNAISEKRVWQTRNARCKQENNVASNECTMLSAMLSTMLSAMLNAMLSAILNVKVVFFVCLVK